MRTTRRTLLRSLTGAVGLATGTFLLSACGGGDASGRYDTGYVEGTGVAAEIDPDKRESPLQFEAATYDGDTFTLASHRGQPVVLNVWYASCAPCRKEAPDLKKIATDYQAKNVTFIGINVRDDEGPAAAFEKKFGIPYSSIPDHQGEIMYALRGEVAPNAVPSTLVIDKQGRTAGRISGVADPSILRAMIDKVLAE